MAKRCSLLKVTVPGIAQKEHKIIDDEYVGNWLHKRLPHHNFYVAPYITLEQFGADHMWLLCLLNARAHYDPEQWIAYDIVQTNGGWHCGYLNVEYCNASVTMYGTEYGKVVPWNKDQAHSWAAIGYPRAQVVLESQALVLKFLRKNIERILKGIELQSLSTKCDQLVQSGFRRSVDQEKWGVLSNQVFLWPLQIDNAHIMELCASRLALAQDELWLRQM